MSTAIPFPPRGAGPVLQQALEAAEAAGQAEATRLLPTPLTATGRPDYAALLFKPSAGRDYGAPVETLVEQAALMAAIPDLRQLTDDEAMIDILALGIAAEVMIRLRKRGAV